MYLERSLLCSACPRGSPGGQPVLQSPRASVGVGELLRRALDRLERARHEIAPVGREVEGLADPGSPGFGTMAPFR